MNIVAKDIIDNIVNDLKEKNKNGKYKYTYRDISEKYNVSICYVSDMALINNLRRRDMRSEYNVNSILKDLKMKKGNKFKYTLTELSLKHNVTVKNLHLIMRTYNLFRYNVDNKFKNT